MMTNYRFKGEFNWYGETYTMWTTAINEDKAFNNMITRLAGTVKRSRRSVANYFNGQIDNYFITKKEEVKNET
uniref:Uncharacterized protein n=1 Tax=viral metagenome TaxID=1070528 RepID=A0A6M3IF03_9ZZZZ